MDAIDRRQILSAAACVTASAVIPGFAHAALRYPGYADRLAHAQELLSGLELEHVSCTLYESMTENFSWWRLAWELSYDRLIDKTDVLREAITDDTPEMRAILARLQIILIETNDPTGVTVSRRPASTRSARRDTHNQTKGHRRCGLYHRCCRNNHADDNASGHGTVGYDRT